MSELSFALSDAIFAPENDGVFSISIQNDLTADTTWNLLTAANSGTPLVIDGNGHTIDLNFQGPGFFIAGGNVTFQNLTIQNALTSGGTGGTGGGGGMGAGAALFIMDGSSVSGANITEATQVTVRNVSFINNIAAGGDSTPSPDSNSGHLGGGGGLGGNGGSGFGDFWNPANGVGGGGGIGPTASGGSAESGGGSTTGGTGFYFIGNGAGNAFLDGDGTTSQGGPQGGGGGSANFDTSLFSTKNRIAAGGGGIGGQSASYNSDTELVSGGNGGFGGGGGAALTNSPGTQQSGNGGFGGGGAGGPGGQAGNGGFGGGGGSSQVEGSNGSGGFGAGDSGGGGLGAGGAIFAMKGVEVTLEDVTFSNNGVAAGTGGDGSDGYAIGRDVFFGSDVTLTVSGGEILTVTENSLGGAAFSGAGDDPGDNAKGSLTIAGGGSLVITGNQSFSGTTFVNASTLTLAAASGSGPSATPQGVSATSDYQVFNTGSAVNFDASTSVIAPVTQSGGTVIVNGNNNTFAANTFTPAAITDTLGISGGSFVINGDNTIITGPTAISGEGEVEVSGTGTIFSGGVTLGAGHFGASAGVSMDSLLISGGNMDLSDSLSVNGNLIITGGSLSVGGVLSVLGLTQVNLTGGSSAFMGGDMGSEIVYEISNGAEASFSDSFANASFSVGTAADPNVSRLAFVGTSGDAEALTEARSITVGSNGILDLEIQGDSSSQYSAVNVGSVTLGGDSAISFDLMNDSTPSMTMVDNSGSLTFDLQSFQNITFTLDEFSDSLAPGQSRTYTIIGSVFNLDLGNSTSILEQLIFDPGENSELTGQFIGLNAASNPDLQLVVTNVIPEPTSIGLLVTGLAVLALAKRLRRKNS